MKPLLALVIAVLLASTTFGAGEEPLAIPVRKLLPGFVPVAESGLDPSGWPREIQCQKDGAVMVFVPLGIFTSGLSDEQMKQLARMELTLEGDNFKGKDPVALKKLCLKCLKVLDLILMASRGKPDFDMDTFLPGFVPHLLDAPDRKLAEEDPIQFIAEGFASEWLKRALLAKMVTKRLESRGKKLSEEDMKRVEATDYSPKSLRDIPGARDELERLEKELALVTEKEAASLGFEQLLITWILRRTEREKAAIPKQELEQWEKGGRTLKALLDIPVVRKQFPDEPDLKESVSMLIEGFTRLTQPEFRLAERVERLKADFGKRRRIGVHSFYIDKYEVTNEQYRRFMAQEKDEKHLPGRPGIEVLWSAYSATPNKRKHKLWDDKKRNHDRQPVTCVSGEDAQAYARWAWKTIPTRSQWQRAAVGDGNRLFPWGSDFDASACRSLAGRILNPKTPPPEGKLQTALEAYRIVKRLRNSTVPSKVGSFPKDRSPFGCYDMAGNVSEWVKSGWAKLEIIGGNAASFTQTELMPARSPLGFVDSYKLLGFRTVLMLDKH